MLCFVIVHLGVFCIDNAPTLRVAIVTVLIATRLCPVATCSLPVATSSVQLQSVYSPSCNRCTLSVTTAGWVHFIQRMHLVAF